MLTIGDLIGLIRFRDARKLSGMARIVPMVVAKQGHEDGLEGEVEGQARSFGELEVSDLLPGDDPDVLGLFAGAVLQSDRNGERTVVGRR